MTNSQGAPVNGTIILNAAGQVALSQHFELGAGKAATYSLTTPLYVTGEWTITVATSDTVLHPYSFVVEQNQGSADSLLSSNAVTQEQIWIAGIAAVATGITAGGVFIGPNLAERARRKEEARKSHFAKIKMNCLIPIGDTAATLLEQNFVISDMFGVVINSVNDPMPRRTFSLFPNRPSGISWKSAELPEGTFDKVLYLDLGHHFPELKAQIDEAQKTLSVRGSHAMELRWQVAMKILVLAKPTIDTMKPDGSVSLMGATIAGGLMFLTGTPADLWPSMFDALKRGNLMPVVEWLKANKELMDTVNQYEVERKFVEGDLAALVSALGKALESERRLPGRCEYLP